MDQKQIEAIVDAVLQQMNAPTGLPRPVQTAAAATAPSVSATDDSPLPDLASEEVKRWIGVTQPKNSKALGDLRSATNARVAVGRAGTRSRTLPYLRFLADHSLSRDTVFKEIPEEWISRTGLFIVQTQISDKDEYLTRPDLGRKLSEEGRKLISEKCVVQPQVQVVLSDGLSTDAMTANYDEILPPLIKGFESAGLKVGTPFFVKYGRVKVEDEIGELLKADVVVLLIGERPGLGQSESMSAYMVYHPGVATTVESDRTVISNIHKLGTPPVEASAVIVETVKKMIAQKTSGINLK
ncbi:MAG TPA: ethanolamine ammonia-lyase subunit EutC [bacterium]|nr:ethanolamine ammonia-lyase subunit EutC [bacterium]HNT65252.1 ethanolamine ammonia-lyase subunit EutC [bacterium]HOX86945.1 ethanolamine ammonia-lyase subunit EutC [bacterium]HPG46276.1 ethanolamine ammonia-lyase subunit EutC [bacterium]HPM98530.1 ethanolamine ammonia-lyase subunit EutC [bacterium]